MEGLTRSQLANPQELAQKIGQTNDSNALPEVSSQFSRLHHDTDCEQADGIPRQNPPLTALNANTLFGVIKSLAWGHPSFFFQQPAAKLQDIIGANNADRLQCSSRRSGTSSCD